MAQFEGVETFALPVSAVFAKLSDAGFLAGCLSGATVGLATPDKAEWRVKPKLAFLSGSLDTTATVTARDPDARVAYQLQAKGIGASSTVDAAMTFAPTADGGTTVTWAGDIAARTGLLKLVPSSLIEGAARKVIADVWADVRRKLLEG
jgi:carbon monoxide dehydrogenase subunit G